MVTVKIPAPPRGLLSNLLGLAGLVAVVAAVGGLTGNWWWSALAGGIAAVALSYIAHLNADSAESAGERTEPLRDVSRPSAWSA
jgi:hypothetical protein